MTDERKNIFIDTVDALFKSSNTDIYIPMEAIDFFEDYKKGRGGAAKEITDKGVAVLMKMKDINDWATAKTIGEAMEVSGRSVSGTMKKLVTDGFVEKQAGNPAVYKITEKGMNFEVPSAEA